ncbi:predicted protein [Nematostella vectensis]|uniref:Uncharacterized protein n=1 Tax=Nematostella vectensis TaxID=45351 RepID=A7SK37_NEMVE|nr:predicted protein [Nematostella vectensis]|eukprot:XP_001628008.1 predicted protein [Nematostella vectensis]
MGIALTGWSRYDYFGTLCELLPAGIPSLVICLTALNRGFMDDNLLEDISSRLGFKDKIDIGAKAIYNDELCNANFPGHEIYKIVCKLSKALHALDMTKETEKGWMLHRQLQSQALSYFRLESARKQSVSCISNMRSVRREAMAELPKIYFNSTVKEWIQDKVNDNIVEATKSKMIIERVQSDFDMLLKQEEIRAKESKNEQTLPSQDLQNDGTLEKQLPTF